MVAMRWNGGVYHLTNPVSAPSPHPTPLYNGKLTHANSLLYLTVLIQLWYTVTFTMLPCNVRAG
jgi:hypothetical protein